MPTDMMRTLVLEEVGGPENLKVTERKRPQPGPNEVVIKVELAGLIYADVELRRGTYFNETPLPYWPGREAAGTIAAVGEGVGHLPVGQRVVALVMSEACHAEYVLASTTMDKASRAPAEIIALPDNVTYGQALTHLVNYRGAHCLFHGWSNTQPGDQVLIHGAGGGMGTMLLQVAHAHGCEVIATCRNDAEIAHCRANGADHIVMIGDEHDYGAEVLRITSGQGAHVIFNGIGGHTVNKDPFLVRPFGEVHLWGYVAGKDLLQPFTIDRCAALKSFSMGNFLSSPHLGRATEAMFERFKSGEADDVSAVFSLADAHLAHRMLDEGRVLGKLALKP